MTTSANSSMTNSRPDIGQAMETIDLIAMRAGFVGLQIAPVLEVPRKSGAVGKIPIDSLLSPKVTKRNPDGKYSRINGKADKVTYTTQDNGLEERVDDATDAEYMDIWDSEYLAGLRTLHGVLEAHEQRVIAAALSNSFTSASGAVWTTTTTDVVATVTARINAVRLRCGRKPNALVLDSEIVNYLLINDSVLDAFVGSADRSPRAIRLAGLAAALGLDEIIEASSVKNTSIIDGTPSLASNWDRTKALLFVKETSTDTKRPQFMRTIHWGNDGSQIGGTFESYREESSRSTIIRNRMETAEVIMYAEAAEVITSVA